MLGNINKNLQNIPQTSKLSGNSPYFVQENCLISLTRVAVSS